MSKRNSKMMPLPYARVSMQESSNCDLLCKNLLGDSDSILGFYDANRSTILGKGIFFNHTSRQIKSFDELLTLRGNYLESSIAAFPLYY